jgi:NAD(P)H-dependent FMN reductase
MHQLMIVQVSTRPTRASDPVAKWVVDHAEAHGKLHIVFVDLREEALPVFDEPKHPRLGQYEHPNTLRWAAKVRAADAFLFVTPEYNFGMPPSLLNALTYLSAEWAYKPAGFVSYGGVSAGTRAQQMAKGPLTTLKVMPIPEAVSVPFFEGQIQNGVFAPAELQAKALAMVLDELEKWARALATIRTA